MKTVLACTLCLSFITLGMFVSSSSAAAVSIQYQHIEEWMVWKNEHSKEYFTETEELEKHIIWLANKKYIDEHNANADMFGYKLTMNQFGDMTSEEYEVTHTCYKPVNMSVNSQARIYVPPKFLSLPDTVDWRTKNAVTDVKNQGQCGSCYAFSAAGALEGAHSLAQDKLVSLSEQNVLDCSVPYGNHGCNGGNMHNVYEYVIDNQGIDVENSYPYKGRQGQCHYSKGSVGATQAGVVTIPTGSEIDLQAATATAGPISIAVDGSSNAFRFYAGGIFDEPNCSTTKLTHSMLVIGYGTYKEKDYWLVKNSWGSNWGMNGYIMMSRNKSNQCGVATAASFPTL